MATALFALHGSYQIAENYNTDSVDGQPAYWKMKGEHTTVSALFNLEQLQMFNHAEKQAIVDADAPVSCEWWDYSDGDWEIITLDDALIEAVRLHCALPEHNDDMGFCRFEFGNEFMFDWVVKQHPEFLKGLHDRCNTMYYIFGDSAA